MMGFPVWRVMWMKGLQMAPLLAIAKSETDVKYFWTQKDGRRVRITKEVWDSYLTKGGSVVEGWWVSRVRRLRFYRMVHKNCDKTPCSLCALRNEHKKRGVESRANS